MGRDTMDDDADAVCADDPEHAAECDRRARAWLDDTAALPAPPALPRLEGAARLAAYPLPMDGAGWGWCSERPTIAVGRAVGQ